MNFWTTNSGNKYQYPFGSVIQSRSYSSGAPASLSGRFGFYTQESDVELNKDTKTALFWGMMKFAKNYMNSGQDLILGAFQWDAWGRKSGLKNNPQPIRLLNNIPSGPINIIYRDYPKYRFYGH